MRATEFVCAGSSPHGCSGSGSAGSTISIARAGATVSSCSRSRPSSTSGSPAAAAAAAAPTASAPTPTPVTPTTAATASSSGSRRGCATTSPTHGAPHQAPQPVHRNRAPAGVLDAAAARRPLDPRLDRAGRRGLARTRRDARADCVVGHAGADRRGGARTGGGRRRAGRSQSRGARRRRVQGRRAGRGARPLARRWALCSAGPGGRRTPGGRRLGRGGRRIDPGPAPARRCRRDPGSAPPRRSERAYARRRAGHRASEDRHRRARPRRESAVDDDRRADSRSPVHRGSRHDPGPRRRSARATTFTERWTLAVTGDGADPWRIVSVQTPTRTA